MHGAKRLLNQELGVALDGRKIGKRSSPFEHRELRVMVPTFLPRPEVLRDREDPIEASSDQPFDLVLRRCGQVEIAATKHSEVGVRAGPPQEKRSLDLQETLSVEVATNGLNDFLPFPEQAHPAGVLVGAPPPRPISVRRPFAFFHAAETYDRDPLTGDHLELDEVTRRDEWAAANPIGRESVPDGDKDLLLPVLAATIEDSTVRHHLHTLTRALRVVPDWSTLRLPGMDRTKTDRALAALRSFWESNLDAVLSRSERVDVRAAALEFFHGVARDVPAYQTFLKRAGVDAGAVRTADDFARLPQTTKDNYHRAFPLHLLCRGGRLDGSDFIAVSSGSAGEPSVWPRSVADEMGTAMRFEQVLGDAMSAARSRTLGVICFALGSWVGGMYTTAACRHIAAKGYPLTLVTPGNNRAEILRVVRALAPSFDQIVLFGYPPFLKDVIDAGRADGIAWEGLSVRLVTAGEVFSETWRTLVCERLGQSDPHLCTASMYGTADGGVLANETPLSVRVRQFLADQPEAARELFGEARLPTLCQYDPLHRYFEENDGDLLFTGDGGAPLVRYRILDRGGVIGFLELVDFMKDHGCDPVGDLRSEGGIPIRQLPFVYVFGRSNFALSFYGANVYPENVAIALERPEAARHVTGKFVMDVVRDDDQDPALHVVVELAQGMIPSGELAQDLALAIRTQVERVNSEFLHYAPAERRTPTVELLPLGHPEYFPVGVKHRYTRAPR